MKRDSFLTDNEKKVCSSFLDNGYLIFDLSQKSIIEKIREQIFDCSKEYLNLDNSVSSEDFFNKTHEFVSVPKLNAFRLFLINKMESFPELRKELYFSGKEEIDTIVGNELCMQKSVNLSIQLPGDTSSLLPLHTDVWSGNSPYEVVYWVPLVDCSNTKSMYLVPLIKSNGITENFSDYTDLNVEEFYQKIKNDTVNLEVAFGSGVIFSHSLLHGNRVNEESLTRWSLNIRFKSALTPYGSKEIGETFSPLNIRPSTRLGYEYKKPSMGEK
jgi:sporadic carbohydrate cluster 2OG-Fe(II) oxygenase